jgi:hypothetical protein
MKKLVTILISILITFYAWSAHATNYYVRNGGSDSNTGLSGSPWATLDKVMSESAAGTFNPGDGVYGKCGSTWTLSNDNYYSWGSSSSGETGNVITLGAYYGNDGSEVVGVSGDRPTIDGQNDAPCSGGFCYRA